MVYIVLPPPLVLTPPPLFHNEKSFMLKRILPNDVIHVNKQLNCFKLCVVGLTKISTLINYLEYF